MLYTFEGRNSCLGVCEIFILENGNYITIGFIPYNRYSLENITTEIHQFAKSVYLKTCTYAAHCHMLLFTRHVFFLFRSVLGISYSSSSGDET